MHSNKRKRFSGFWALIGAFVLLMIWGTPTHPTFIVVWLAVAAILAVLLINSGFDERGIYREEVLGFGIGMAVLTFYFALDGRTDITVVGALLTVIAFALSRRRQPRPVEQTTPSVQNAANVVDGAENTDTA